MTLILVTYDVSTVSPAGRRRLRRVAKICENFGQRVQDSVFECWLDFSQFVEFRASVVSHIDPDNDSIRFYMLGEKWKGRIEHIGAKPGYDPEGPLIL